MPGFSAIADVGQALVKLLRENMVPEIIPNTDAIGLCSPDDRGDITLGLYLYDVRDSEELAGVTASVNTEKTHRYPSQFLNLYYSVTAFSSSDVKFRASEEQRILGKVLQVMGDNATLNDETLTGLTYPIRIEKMKVDNEEKIRIWNMPNTPYKLSIYYKVYPVEIESQRVKSIVRVVDVDFDVEEKPQG